MKVIKTIKRNKKPLTVAGVFLAVILLVVLLVPKITNTGHLSEQGQKDKKQEHVKEEAEASADKDKTKEASAEALKQAEASSDNTQETFGDEQQTETPEAVSVPDPTPAPVVASYPESEGERKVYLTFDDGTSAQTDRILDILAQYGVKATFFVTAQGGEENAARYRRIVAEGHSIGLHSVSHKYKEVYASLDTFIADVEGIRRFVLDTTGVDSHLYRFPGGSSNSVSNVPIEDCIRYLNQNGYRYFDWNLDTADAVNRSQSVDELVSRALGEGIDKYHNCVILMHDSGSQSRTVEALPRIIEGLKARGLEILPITGDTPVVQHKKASSVQ